MQPLISFCVFTYSGLLQFIIIVVIVIMKGDTYSTAGSYGNYIWAFEKLPDWFPWSWHHFIFLPAMCAGPCFSASLPVWVISICLVIAIPLGMKWHLIVVLTWISLMVVMLRIFSCIVKKRPFHGHLNNFLKEMSIYVFCPFLSWVV